MLQFEALKVIGYWRHVMGLSHVVEELVQVVAVALLDTLKRHNHDCEIRQCVLVAVVIDRFKFRHEFWMAHVVCRARAGSD